MKRFLKEIKSLNIVYYVITFSAVVLLIISIMGVYLYQFYYKTIYNDFVTSNEEHLSSVAVSHENDLRILDDIAYQIGLSDRVTGFLLTEDAIKSIDLKQQIYQYTAVSQFFDMMFYLYHGDHYLYNHSTSIEVDLFVSTACRLQLTDPQIFREELYSESSGLRVLPEQGVTGNWIKNYIGDADVVIYIQAVAPEYEETVLFLVPDSYYDSLMENDPENLRSDFIIYDGQVIVSRGTVSVEEDDLLSLLYASEETRRVKIDGESYLLTAQTGESGLTYCSMQSLDIFRSRFFAGQWGIILLLVLCTIPATLLILLFSRHLTARVRGLNRMLDTSEDIYNFSSIENGIQMLVTSNEAREKENLQLKRTQFINRFVRGKYQDSQMAEEAAQAAAIELEGSLFQVILFSERSSNENAVHSKILDIIAQAAHSDGYGILLISKSQSLFVLFADTRERLEGILSSIFAVGKEYCEEFVMAVSDYHTILTEGPNAYLEADTAFDNRFLQDNNKIIRFTDITVSTTEECLSETELQNLRYALRNRDKERVRQSIEEICRKMTKKSPSLIIFRLIYNQVIHILLTEWSAGEQQEDGREGIYNVFTLSQCLTIQELNQVLQDACEAVIESREQESLTEPDVVQKAIAYMQENYPEPELTMAAVAEYLNISSVTLAVMFKNAIGIRPSDFLANLRMEKARELISTTSMQIQEISLTVGYEDSHVFIRRFKKYTGLTPGQYRKERPASGM